ncbi:transposable element Tcb1 transposase [Trichonephila clavipes]|nr:transposable element Tcb1 transposase [Trichonephila clavipes]
MHVKNLRPTIKYGGGTQIVWGCMASSGVGNLHFIDSIMNKYVYLDILNRNLRQSASKLGILGHFKLYQDNVPKHTADIYNMLTKYQMIKFIDFCEVWFLPESVGRVAAIVGDHRCHTPRHRFKETLDVFLGYSRPSSFHMLPKLI